ncbi:MAG: hypothetical protein HY646_06050 [Acidobacteria bacterium]|nr:hypothetical protein [Acidobacteriota bacterium]
MIVIVTDSNTPRGTANCNALVSIGHQAFQINADGICEVLGATVRGGSNRVAATLPRSPDFVLLHHTDRTQSWWKDLLGAFKDRGISPPVIRYSYRTPPDEPPPGEIWLRAITSDGDALSTAEAKALCRWSLEEFREESRPALLRLNAIVEQQTNRAALAVLCQGFLAMMVEPTTGEVWPGVEQDGSRPEVEEALAFLVGASDLQSEKVRERLREILEPIAAKWSHEQFDERRIRVRLGRWWRDVFPQPKENITDLFGEDSKPELLELFETFSDEKLTHPISPGLVARAYIAIARKS